jgi:hypothetical protein
MNHSVETSYSELRELQTKSIFGKCENYGGTYTKAPDIRAQDR